MLDGGLEWQRIALSAPKIATQATDEYFDDQMWCDERNLHPGSGNALSDCPSRDRGFTRKRGHGGVRGFRSLVVRQGNGS